ncbi:hypothetical protein [Mesobacillus jeotgali]|nr:hypothetical protein [Mesobacillus jeotgali]
MSGYRAIMRKDRAIIVSVGAIIPEKRAIESTVRAISPGNRDSGDFSR